MITIFVSDLDNTLIFSYKHKQENDQCVEYIDGKVQSYCTPRTIAGLKEICTKQIFLPLTTRSIRQFLRIQWPEGCVPEYAVTTNGAILLKRGKVEPTWYAESRALTEPWAAEMDKLKTVLAETYTHLQPRMVDEMYLFLPCQDEAEASSVRKAWEPHTHLKVQHVGRKLYFFPPGISKGAAVERLKARFDGEIVICAGDSIIDVDMLARADIAIVPNAALMQEHQDGEIHVCDEERRFPDFVVETVLRVV